MDDLAIARAAHVVTAREAAFAALQAFHWVMLALSAITILGAVTGTHGLSLF